MIEPKDGEWWMCETDGVQLVLMWKGSIWVKTKCGHFGAYSMATVKPLYKMVKAVESKPRTKVVYEPVNQNEEGGAYWECARDFAKGVEFASSQDKCNINDNRMLLAHYENRSLCRVVEKEIDWKDELLNWFNSPSANSTDGSSFDVKMDDEQKAYLGEKDFIEMCHLVASLTDKPE